MSAKATYKPGTVGDLLEKLKKIEQWHLDVSVHPAVSKKQQKAHKLAAKTLEQTAKLVLNLKDTK